MSYPYADLREYLARLERDDLLVRVTERVNKDTELVPLVRLQFRGLEEERRRAFVFDRVTDSRGRDFDASVAIATFAPSPAVYAAALGVDGMDRVGEVWARAFGEPIDPRVERDGPVKEVRVVDPDELEASGGVDAFPHPISTPGFDNAPYLTSPYWVTKDPETGIYNVGVYRGQIKAPRRVGLQMDTPSQHIAIHLRKAAALGQRLEAAVVIGAVPALGLASVQKLPFGVSEYGVAGGLMGEPMALVPCETVDLAVPATAELVIEGSIEPTELEPEGPFGEASGFMGPRTSSPVLEVSAITHRRSPIVQAFISEFPPSESTLMRRIAFENVYLRFLRESCNIHTVKAVAFYEMATCNMMFVVQLEQPSAGQAWQALYAASGYEPSLGKFVIAVDEDVDPADPEMLIWALAFRVQPRRDVHVLDHKLPRLDPSADVVSQDPGAIGSALLIDATRPRPYPPTSLPTRPHMERAQEIWDGLGLPELSLREPTAGYELGAWTEENREEARLAELGRYLETGAKLARREEPGR